jgi:gamma-glutamyltranspeptidase / glutathione hydrolase
MRVRRAALILAGAATVIATAVAAGACRGDDGDAETVVVETPTAQADTPTPTPEPGNHVQAVVTAHDLATQAGLEMLERGGSAADAAVAIAAALGVVEPWFSSPLGGGTWALYYDAEADEVTSLDGVGPTGSNASPEDFAARAGQAGMHQANVPGAWDGWMLWLEEYGRLDLGEVLAPAIRIGREGYTIGAEMAQWLNIQAELMQGRPSTLAIYAPDGMMLGQGDTVFQHGMADTFEALAEAYDGAWDDGRSAALQAARDYFYRGPLAEAIVSYSDQFGGYLTLEDFAGFEAEIVEPISIEWDDEITVYQNPPNSQGITMLIALNILKGFDFSDLGPDSAEAVHLKAEALKLAFADRTHHVGDPARVDVPVEELLSDAHAERQRARISDDGALTWPIPPVLASQVQAGAEMAAGDTTTFHVVDRDGNAAAVTTSLGAQFFVIGETGIHINNRMRFHQVDEGNPNIVAPGYKVRHTSNPYMAFRNGRPYILGGNTGADTQSQVQVQQFLHVVAFGLSAQEAIARPRFTTTAFPGTVYPWSANNDLQLEGGLAALGGELQARGHSLGGPPAITGNGGMIVLDAEGTSVEVGVEHRNETSSGEVIPPEE